MTNRVGTTSLAGAKCINKDCDAYDHLVQTVLGIRNTCAWCRKPVTTDKGQPLWSGRGNFHPTLSTNARYIGESDTDEVELCRRGAHPRIPENTAILKNGQRRCKLCQAEANQRYREKRKKR